MLKKQSRRWGEEGTRGATEGKARKGNGKGCTARKMEEVDNQHPARRNVKKKLTESLCVYYVCSARYLSQGKITENVTKPRTRTGTRAKCENESRNEIDLKTMSREIKSTRGQWRASGGVGWTSCSGAGGYFWH